MTGPTYTETVTGCIVTNDNGQVLELNVEQEHEHWAWRAAQHDDGERESDAAIGQGGIASGVSH